MKIANTEIFLLPAGTLIGTEAEDYYILYAPISQDICFMEKKDALELCQYLEHHKIPCNKELVEFADNLVGTNKIPVIEVPSARDTTRMSLMPNYKCNFSCSYCYSAKGRSNQTISWKKVEAALNYFIDSNRIKPSHALSLFISGGGEPLLSWDIVSKAIEYSCERAQKQGFSLRISLITNGSLLTEDKIEWLRDRKCTVCVSFEILEDLQNTQRGHYNKVRQSLEMLGHANVPTMINATITPESVGRMVEMTYEVIKSYSFVKQFTMEPVTSADLFCSAHSMRTFYDTFIDEYAKAKQLAKEHGLNIRFDMDEALDSTVVRHCPGKFCLTAEGTFSACHLATSPKEKRYEKCVYGRVNEDGAVEINEEKFRELYNDNMFAKQSCDDCFVRWNCGGECMARNDTYPSDFMEEVCRFNRKWMMMLLKERLEKETIEECGLTLREFALQEDMDILEKKEIYILPDDNNKWLLYAPLADSAAQLSFNDIHRLGRALASQDTALDGNNKEIIVDIEALDLLKEITDVVPVWERDGYVRSVGDFINLSILPNNICNFSCSYCYSAKGRSKTRLSFAKAKVGVDFFLAPERCHSEMLTVSIFGGGEPLLSWNDTVRPILYYLKDKASEQHRTINVKIITNGSLLPVGFISTCLDCNVDLVVSYEVLKDVQDTQRHHYVIVTENIRTMIEGGVIPSINTVVTPFNVKRIEETVEQLHRMFPEIRYLSVEPVIDAEITDRHDFFSQFISNFLSALKKAELYGIVLSCSVSRKVDQTIERYCAGEMAICADGSISICPCVSSASEPNYFSYIYGNITKEGTVMIDSDKLSRLLSINVDTYSWCKSCFARWNCAGGCMNNNNKNMGRQDKDFCWFTREMTRLLIKQRLTKEQE